jgi:hypothetical protein
MERRAQGHVAFMRLRVIVVFGLVKAGERAMNEEAPVHCSFAIWQQKAPGRERTLSGVGLSMEGTSGAAECALLRGRAYEAALEGDLRLSPAFFRQEGFSRRTQVCSGRSTEAAKREAGCGALSS